MWHTDTSCMHAPRFALQQSVSTFQQPESYFPGPLSGMRGSLRNVIWWEFLGLWAMHLVMVEFAKGWHNASVAAVTCCCCCLQAAI